MAFPVVSSTNTTTIGSNTTSHTINLPASIGSGDLILVLFCVDGNGTATTPTGYTAVFTNIGSTQRTCLYYRIADGTEGSTISITTSTTQQSSSAAYRITSWHGTTPPEGATVTGSNTTPDPPNLAPSWGAEDNLYICGWGYNDGTTTTTAFSTNYTGSQLSPNSGGAGGTGCAISTRDLNGSSDNPGTGTISASENHTAYTVAVRPAAAGATYEADLTTGSYTLTGQNPIVSYNRVADLTLGTFTQTGQDPTVSYNRVADLTTGAYTLSGQDPTVSYNRVGDLTTGSYTLTGQNPDVNYNPAGGPTYEADLTLGTYTLSGQTLTVSYNRVADLTAGSFTFSGQDPTISRGYSADLTAGTYTFAGQDVTTVFHWSADLATGTYTFAGQTMTAAYSGEVLGATVELSDSAVYTVALNDAAVYTVVVTDSAVYVLALADEIL